MKIAHWVLGLTLAGGWLVCGPRVSGQDEDSPSSRYFEQLRRRGFFLLAESHATSRLEDPLLPAAARIDLAIELSRTFVAHALSASDDQQAKLWDKAAAVLKDELSAAGDTPRRIVLEVYAALIPAGRAEQLVWDVEAAPFEDPVHELLGSVSADALRRLSGVEKTLAERLRILESRKKPAEGVSAAELRRLLSHVRLRTGFVLQARARLSPAGSQERHSDLIDADEHFRKLTNAANEERQSAAKLGLAISNRLRDELERSFEMLDNLAKETSAPREFQDAVQLERARTQLANRRPDDAAQILLQLRTGRERLPGEYWQIYFQTLTTLRRAAAQRQVATLIEELNARAEAALQDVDQQAGGSWSRRCREIWAAAESVERYGQRIVASISRGKSEYLAGRMEAAVSAYSSALELAEQDDKTNLAMDVGYTLAAIQAKLAHWEDVAKTCRQLVVSHADHVKATEIDLLHLHALGRLYDQQRDAERRAAYERAMDEHVERFPQSPSVSEVEFLRGQLLETSGHPVEAIAAYERVKPDHPRANSAMAAVARCFVVRLLQLREAGQRDHALEHRTLNQVANELKSLPDDAASWTDAQVELAYHAVRVLLLIDPPKFAEAERRLKQLDQAASQNDGETQPTQLRREIGRRTGPLRLIAIAGQGRPQEAEQLLGSLEQSGPTELLAVAEELSQIDIPSPATARQSLSEMQLASAEALDRRRNELTPAQQRRLDLALAKSYLATTQVTKALGVYQRLLAEHPKDAALARTLAEQLKSREELGCRNLVRACWQRVESLSAQNSPEWLAARAEFIESCWRAGDKDFARKLIKLTNLLHVPQADEDMKKRYAELETKLK